ncbi:MAG: hypothetical protein HY403_11540 [Elusimicrobia bacterium]|nr:hypothetical protein [Elusimicrobiota bacterium]
MGDTAPPSPSFFSSLGSRLFEPRTLLRIALSLTLGAAGAGVGWRLYLKPKRAIAEIRYQSHLCLMRLYDLQMAYRGAHGVFAGDLETLLASAPDGAQLREKLRSSVDLETLAVVGGADRFRLEANVLDPQRTSVKLRGPLGKR